MKIKALLPTLVVIIHPCSSLNIPVSQWRKELRIGFERRVAADPSFAKKSVIEVLLAGGTQLSAEYTQRGPHRLVAEVDFVVAGILTAVIGKYYSMWRVAKTEQRIGDVAGLSTFHEPSVFGIAVPSNAFQEAMLDGVTKPTIVQRFGAIIAPIPSLFKAGVLASTLGYGLTAVAIQLRSMMLPSFATATRQVNIIHAALYTGAFMAVVSNLRYQLLQGVIEPFLERLLCKWSTLQNLAIYATRYGNGWLGSVLAIAGMRWLGLQQLRTEK